MLSFHVGKTNAPSNGSSKGDMKGVLVSLLQQRVFAEANVSSNLQNVMSMKCVSVLVSTKKAIVMPEALRRLFETHQDKLPDRGQHRKRADQQHFITGQPKREVLLAAWHAFTDLREKHAAAREAAAAAKKAEANAVEAAKANVPWTDAA